jgi:hypothetical protein
MLITVLLVEFRHRFRGAGNGGQRRSTFQLRMLLRDYVMALDIGDGET